MAGVVKTPVKVASKWGKAYWVDLAERTASTAVAAALSVLIAHSSDLLSVTPDLAWTLIGAPAAVSLLKGVLANLSGNSPTASLVNVDSLPGPLPSDLKAIAAAAEKAAIATLDTSPPPQ